MGSQALYPYVSYPLGSRQNWNTRSLQRESHICRGPAAIGSRFQGGLRNLQFEFARFAIFDDKVILLVVLQLRYLYSILISITVIPITLRIIRSGGWKTFRLLGQLITFWVLY